jgi:N6-adenosine-specific RNA methylase IME4
MPELVKYVAKALPATIDDLHTYILIENERLKVHQAKIRAINKIPAAHAYKEAALQDGHICANNLLVAEAKLGELLAVEPPKRAKGSSTQVTSLPSLPPGLTKKESHQAQTIFKHPKVVEMVIAQSQIKGSLATAETVYKEIKKQERQEMHQAKHVQPFPQGKYAAILADPPWKYDNSGFNEAAEGQYPTMTLEEICQLPVPDLATESTILFLWAVNPLLPEALQVLKSWGFTYKTNMAWIKDRGRGKGWFLKSRHELILIGVRGDTPHPLDRPDSCFEADRGPVHSRKPLESYEIIESMYSGPKVELFARSNRPGWDSWGNEG